MDGKRVLVKILRPRLWLGNRDEEILSLSCQRREALENDAALIGVDPQWTIRVVCLQMEVGVVTGREEGRGGVGLVRSWLGLALVSADGELRGGFCGAQASQNQAWLGSKDEKRTFQVFRLAFTGFFAAFGVFVTAVVQVAHGRHFTGCHTFRATAACGSRGFAFRRHVGIAQMCGGDSCLVLIRGEVSI